MMATLKQRATFTSQDDRFHQYLSGGLVRVNPHEGCPPPGRRGCRHSNPQGSTVPAAATAAPVQTCHCCGRDPAQREFDNRKAIAIGVKTVICPGCATEVVRPEALTDEHWRRFNRCQQVVTLVRSDRLPPLHRLTYTGSGGMFSVNGRPSARRRF